MECTVSICKVDVDMLNTVKIKLADVLSVSPLSEQRWLAQNACLYSYIFLGVIILQYCIQRTAFDKARASLQSGEEQEPNLESVTILLRRLLFFYSVANDTQRLVSA